jgi:hypothetical protein
VFTTTDFTDDTDANFSQKFDPISRILAEPQVNAGRTLGRPAKPAAGWDSEGAGVRRFGLAGVSRLRLRNPSLAPAAPPSVRHADPNLRVSASICGSKESV